MHVLRYQPEQWQRWHWQTAQRYYIAELTQDLFGQWLVCRTWGSRTSARGNQKFLPTASYEHALRLLHTTNQRRKARGYQPAWAQERYKSVSCKASSPESWGTADAANCKTGLPAIQQEEFNEGDKNV